ncbi:hypothetical protein Back11_05780 [Paenibacillus baekrokdamisoli]|uniref:Uncharacterized protein n=1 Tax=Paenibacillus baekrokdamisoli TaxID=1712516 RepID=A0A3G9J3E6_9BACL|nr:hypothetical protein [Paenibacillus baekrokdamisoli]BBH19233.1 hypothetical protein Back11_05780 [Paenibacillus baekrokdamisoli]
MHDHSIKHLCDLPQVKIITIERLKNADEILSAGFLERLILTDNQLKRYLYYANKQNSIFKWKHLIRDNFIFVRCFLGGQYHKTS